MNSRSSEERKLDHHSPISTSIRPTSSLGSGISPRKAASQLPITTGQLSSRTLASASAGCGPKADDPVDLLTLEVCKHRVQRQSVSVDVRDQTDAQA